ncbi:hypothetical protein F4703DRAFT_1962163 [Phycomyces blakesleeanus]
MGADSYKACWEASFDHFVRPTMYMAAIFSVLLALVALTAAIGIFKKRFLRLVYFFPLPCFTISLLSVFNDVTELALMLIGKDLFLAGCAKEKTELLLSVMQSCDSCVVEQACNRIWNSSLVWISTGTIFNLGIDICFICCLYRFQRQQTQLSRIIPKNGDALSIECRQNIAIGCDNIQEASTLAVGQTSTSK